MERITQAEASDQEVDDTFQAFASRRDVTLAACDHGYENLPWDKFKTRTYLLKVGF